MEQVYDIFICYSRKDYLDKNQNIIPGNVVSTIKDTLTKEGISFWFDEEGIYSGQNFIEKIVNNIESSKLFLYLSTANANNSRWTCKEIASANEFGKPIIPVRIDRSPYNKKVMFLISDLDHIEYYNNPEIGLRDMVLSIKAHLQSLKEEEEGKKKEEEARHEAEIKRLEEERRKKEEEERRRQEEQKRIVAETKQLQERVHELEKALEALIRDREQLKLELEETRKKALFQLPQAIQNLILSPDSFTIDFGSSSTDIKYSAAEQSINYWPASKGLPSGKCNKVYGNRIGHHFSPMQRFINWLSKSKEKTEYVYSSVFAPAQISPRSHMLIQVFLHYPEVTEKLKTLAKESQETAERRDYIPLECRLKKGDKVDVQMSIYGTKPLMSESKTITWHGPYKKCSFEFFVDEGIGVN